jgi:curved DNA-binding protein
MIAWGSARPARIFRRRRNGNSASVAVATALISTTSTWPISCPPSAARAAWEAAGAGQDYEVVARVTLEQVYRGDQIEVRVELPETDARGLPHRVPRTFQVTLPKGAQSGQRLRLPGKGGAGVNGGKAGDLYVVIELAPHSLYRVSGRDLFIDLPLAPWEAALGATVELPTLGGAVELVVSPGTSSGKQLRLAGRGLPAPDGAGDLFAVVRVEVPKSIGSRERELFRQLEQASGFNPRAHWEQWTRGTQGAQGAKGAGA